MESLNVSPYLEEFNNEDLDTTISSTNNSQNTNPSSRNEKDKQQKHQLHNQIRNFDVDELIQEEIANKRITNQTQAQKSNEKVDYQDFQSLQTAFPHKIMLEDINIVELSGLRKSNMHKYQRQFEQVRKHLDKDGSVLIRGMISKDKVEKACQVVQNYLFESKMTQDKDNSLIKDKQPGKLLTGYQAVTHHPNFMQQTFLFFIQKFEIEIWWSAKNQRCFSNCS
eukprot:403359276